MLEVLINNGGCENLMFIVWHGGEKMGVIKEKRIKIKRLPLKIWSIKVKMCIFVSDDIKTITY
jgi:hypothetical protein